MALTPGLMSRDVIEIGTHDLDAGQLSGMDAGASAVASNATMSLIAPRRASVEVLHGRQRPWWRRQLDLMRCGDLWNRYWSCCPSPNQHLLVATG